MKIIDITRELFSAPVFEGDSSPRLIRRRDYRSGDAYVLSDISLCVHNGTHIDAPLHFIENGDDISGSELANFIGNTLVAEFEGTLDEKTARALAQAAKRVLIKGKCEIGVESARAFADEGLILLGVEGQSVAEKDCARVHKILLSSGIALLEGLCLDKAETGEYFLSALPLRLAGCEGSPCRAVLIKF